MTSPNLDPDIDSAPTLALLKCAAGVGLAV